MAFKRKEGTVDVLLRNWYSSGLRCFDYQTCRIKLSHSCWHIFLSGYQLTVILCETYVWNVLSSCNVAEQDIYTQVALGKNLATSSTSEHYVLAVATVLHSMMTLLGPFIHQHTSKSIPYSGLERLEVSLESTEGGDMEKCYSEASSYLASILQHQRAINSLSLQSWPLTSPKLVSANSSLFYSHIIHLCTWSTWLFPFSCFRSWWVAFSHLLIEQSHMNQATHCKIPAHSLLTLDIESLAVVPMLSCVIGYPSLYLNTFFLTNLGTLKNEGVLDFLVNPLCDHWWSNPLNFG